MGEMWYINAVCTGFLSLTHFLLIKVNKGDIPGKLKLSWSCFCSAAFHSSHFGQCPWWALWLRAQRPGEHLGNNSSFLLIQLFNTTAFSVVSVDLSIRVLLHLLSSPNFVGGEEKGKMMKYGDKSCCNFTIKKVYVLSTNCWSSVSSLLAGSKLKVSPAGFHILNLVSYLSLLFTAHFLYALI